MIKKLNWQKIIFVSLIFLGAWVSAQYGQPLLHHTETIDGVKKESNNELAINVIVTVFSILAGFLVAIIAIIGDPALLPQGSWRVAEIERPKIHQRIVRHQWLFTIYLVTLGSIFVALILHDIYPRFALWFERIFLFFGFIAFTFSLLLPEALMKLQKEKIDAVIEDRRKRAGKGNAEE